MIRRGGGTRERVVGTQRSQKEQLRVGAVKKRETKLGVGGPKEGESSLGTRTDTQTHTHTHYTQSTDLKNEDR